MYHYIDLDGKRRTVYALTLDALREKEKAIQDSLRAGINVTEANKTTLNGIFDRFMETKANLRATTLENYRRVWRLYVLDALGKKAISDVKTSDVKALLAGMTAKGLSRSTAKLTGTLLKGVFQLAEEDNLIGKNPAVGVKYSGTVKTREALTEAQQERLLSFVKANHAFRDRYPFLVTALGTGLRVGELTGLVWANIDLKNNLLHVDHQLQYRKCSDDEKTVFRVTKLKTAAGKRDIPLSPDVRAALAAQKKLSLARGTLNTATVDGISGFIFTSKNGQPYATNAINSFLKNVVEQYNKLYPSEPLPHVSAHILRHTACTRMAEAHIDIKLIQKTMGHKSAKITLDTYTHATDTERAQEQISKMVVAGGYM